MGKFKMIMNEKCKDYLEYDMLQQVSEREGIEGWVVQQVPN